MIFQSTDGISGKKCILKDPSRNKNILSQFFSFALLCGLIRLASVLLWGVLSGSLLFQSSALKGASTDTELHLTPLKLTMIMLWTNRSWMSFRKARLLSFSTRVNASFNSSFHHVPPASNFLFPLHYNAFISGRFLIRELNTNTNRCFLLLFFAQDLEKTAAEIFY